MFALLAPLIGPIMDKALALIPNANDRAKAKEVMELDLQQAITQASALQAKINLVEAGHKSVFVAGWRPFIGWVCGAGLAWAYIVQPVAVWYIAIYHPDVKTLPAIDTSGLYQLVLAMLGMGGLRTWEKTKGVARP